MWIFAWYSTAWYFIISRGRFICISDVVAFRCLFPIFPHFLFYKLFSFKSIILNTDYFFIFFTATACKTIFQSIKKSIFYNLFFIACIFFIIWIIWLIKMIYLAFFRTFISEKTMKIFIIILNLKLIKQSLKYSISPSFNYMQNCGNYKFTSSQNEMWITHSPLYTYIIILRIHYFSCNIIRNIINKANDPAIEDNILHELNYNLSISVINNFIF